MSVLKKAGDGETEITMEFILAEVNKTLDAKLGAKFDDFKKTGLSEAIKVHVEPLNTSMTALTEAITKITTHEPNPSPGQKTPEMNAQVKQLSDKVDGQGKTILQLQKERDDANAKSEQTERFATIKGTLTGLPFVSDKAVDTAFNIVQPFVKRLDDQSLVATINGDNFPVDVFVKDFLAREHGYLFKSTNSSGSGASSGASGGSKFGQKFDTSSIKVGMKPEDRAAAAAAIGEALQTV